jgi:hypothetical protein
MIDLAKARREARALTREQFLAHYPHRFLIWSAAARPEPTNFATMQWLGPADSSREPRLRVLPIVKAPGNPYPERISVGRARNCDVVLREASVSKLHAHFDADGKLLFDLGSQNGTRVEGKRLLPNHGEVVRVGDAIHFGLATTSLIDGAALFELLRSQYG